MKENGNYSYWYKEFSLESLLICFRLKYITDFMEVLSNHGARRMTMFNLDRSKDRSACALHNMDIVYTLCFYSYIYLVMIVINIWLHCFAIV